MAGQIAELAHRTLRERLPRIDTRRRGSSCSTPRPRCCRRSATGSAVPPRRRLERWGSRSAGHQGRRRRRHRHRHRESPTAPATRIEALTKVWAAGVQAARWARARRAVRRRARPGRPRQGAARPHPARAPRGLRRRRHDGPRQPPRRRPGRDPGRPLRRQHLKARLDGKDARGGFHYWDKGSMATISRFSAVASIGKAAVRRLRRLGAVARRSTWSTSSGSSTG